MPCELQHLVKMVDINPHYKFIEFFLRMGIPNLK